MTNALCGTSGSITGAGLTEVQDWKVKISQDTYDATNMTTSEGWVEKVGCVIRGNGSAKALNKPTMGPGTILLEVGNVYSISGDCIVTDATENSPVDGLITFDTDFTFTGTISVDLS
jgi:hypothetical protein